METNAVKGKRTLFFFFFEIKQKVEMTGAGSENN